MSEVNQIQAALLHGEEAAIVKQAPQRLGAGIPFVIVRTGYDVKAVESMLEHPVRVRSTIEVRDQASFIRYTNDYKDADTVVFANIGDRTITAVLDYHKKVSEDSARWGQHRVVLTCLLTEDWKRWAAINKKPQSQLEFAQFIEDNLPNIGSPSGSDLLTMVRTLQAKKDVTFQSVIRLEDGSQNFTYIEDVTATAARGELKIPDTIHLVLKPFEGGEDYRVDARFRYRLESGALKLTIELVRHEAVIEDAFRIVREAIVTAINPAPVLSAKAPTVA